MPKRGWLPHAALGLTALVGLLLIDVVPRHLGSSDKPAQSRQPQASENERAAQEALAWLRLVQQQRQTKEAGDERRDSADGSKNDLKDALDLAAQWSSAMAAERMARLSVWQIVIGLGGVLVVAYSLSQTRRALRTADENYKLARADLIANNRPKIILRTAFAPQVVPLRPIAVWFQMTNVGGSRAWIVESRLDLKRWQKGQPIFMKMAAGQADMIGALGPGESRLFQYEEVRGEKIVYMGPQDPANSEDSGIYFSGTYTYLDAPESGIRRQAAFRRKLNTVSQRFERVPDNPEDCEYVD